MNTTPLRYPGGKSIMTSFFEEIFTINSMENVIYAEPYAGGAGSAINLLLKDKVDEININDISLGVFSFWHFLVKESDNFLRLLETIPVNLEEWQKQRVIFKTAIKPSLELGFATFFLSRTNRSGILNAGPMGGQDPTKQDNSKYKLDCRYNKVALFEKFEKIIKKRNKIKVYNCDALAFLKRIPNNNTFVYLDPPYYGQGKALYINYYKHSDHLKLSIFLRNTTDFKWVLSYDNVCAIQKLYSDFDSYEFNLIYTAQKVKTGTEFLTYSKNIKLPINPVIRRKSTDINIIKIDTNNNASVQHAL